MPIRQLDIGRALDVQTPLATIASLSRQRGLQEQESKQNELQLQRLALQLSESKKKADEETAVKKIISNGGDPQAVYQKLLAVNPDTARTYLTNSQSDILQAQQQAQLKIQTETGKETAPQQIGGTGTVTPPAESPDTRTIAGVRVPSPVAQPAPIQAGYIGAERNAPVTVPYIGQPPSTIVPPNAAEVTRAKTLAEQVKSDMEQRKKIAEQQAAEQSKAADTQSKTVETGDGIYQWNPATKRYDIRIGSSKNPAPKSLQSKDMVLKNGQRATLNFDPASGKYHDASGADVSAQVQGDYHVPPQPQVAIIQGVDENGNKVTKLVDKKAGTAFAAAPTVQETNRRDQAKIINNYADHIITLIDENPSAVGPILGRIARGETIIGNVSPEAKALGTALGSLVALQPVLHGFRGGSQTVDHFVGVLGDQRLNAAALKASIREIKTLASEIRGENVAPSGNKTIKFSDLPK